MKTEKWLAALIFVTVLASGCIRGLQDPDPVIPDPSQRQGTLDVIGGNTTVTVDVRNNGYTGNILLTLEVLDENGSVLERFDRLRRMEGNTTRQVTIEAQVPEGAETYRLTVQSAD